MCVCALVNDMDCLSMLQGLGEREGGREGGRERERERERERSMDRPSHIGAYIRACFYKHVPNQERECVCMCVCVLWGWGYDLCC